MISTHGIAFPTYVSPPQLHRCSFTWEQKVVDPAIVKNVAARPHEVPQDEVPSFLAWFKALFDQNSDGIEDTILRCLTTEPWSMEYTDESSGRLSPKFSCSLPQLCSCTRSNFWPNKRLTGMFLRMGFHTSLVLCSTGRSWG